MVATASTSTTEYVDGVVSRVNGHGFMLAGHDGWMNISKYAQPAPALPADGERVRVGLDKGGFVRSVETVNTLTAQTAEDSEGCVSAPAGPVDRETRIGRMAALNTATAIFSSGGQQAAIKDVLALAGQPEQWVTR